MDHNRRELANKLFALRAFAGKRPNSNSPLCRPEYYEIWHEEGRAYKNTLTGRKRTQRLNPGNSIPANTGTALAICQLAIEKKKSANEIIQATFSTIQSICKTGLISESNAAESFGLVSRLLLTASRQRIARCFEADWPSRIGCFWHGYGRGSYFSPVNSMAGCELASCSLFEVQTKPPNYLAQANALSGLAWALTLVNLKNPEVLEEFLARHGDLVRNFDAFSHGVSSALMVWNDWSPNSVELANFFNHPVNRLHKRTATRWKRFVRDAGHHAIENVYPVLKRENRLDEIFHFIPPK